MRTLALVLFSVFVFSACGAPDVADIAGLPDQGDIQDQVARDLAKQGIEMPDLEQQEESESAGKALVLGKELKDSGLVDPTAKELWPQVNEYAKAAFSGATLIGFNNFGTMLDDNYTIPGREFANGKSNYWVYIFAHDSADMADGKVDERSEAFGVLFMSGNLKLVQVEMNQEEVNPSDLFGEGLLAVDTSVLADNAKKAVKEKFGVESIAHISFACRPMWPATFATGNGDCRVTLYESQQSGFLVDIFNKTGEVQKVEQVDFREF